MANISNEYFVKRGSQEFSTIPSLFAGVRVLKITGFDALGKPVNIYTAQWTDSQREDYMVTSKVTIDDAEYDAIFRENVDLDITFIVSDKYSNEAINVREQHDAFIAYMTDGALYIKSNYTGRTMRCVCLKEYKPTTTKLKRTIGSNYILGTLTMHTLDMRAGEDDGFVGNPYQQPSGGEPSPTPPSPTVNTQNVYDTHFGKTQAWLNQEVREHFLPNNFIATEDGLYQIKNDEVFPVSHPDISSNPSILPQRFGNKKIYEVVITIEYDSSGQHWHPLGEVVPNTSVIMSGTMFNSFYLIPAVFSKEEGQWLVLPGTPIPAGQWFVLVQYYDNSGEYYYEEPYYQQ